MKQRLFIVLALLVLGLLMVGLNAVSYVQKVREPDKEMTPIRSTYHPGATGTKAFYTLLAETGREVTRWQRPPAELLTETRQQPATLVMIGPFRREVSEDDTSMILSWVSSGGRLVIIDRDPPKQLLTTSLGWTLEAKPGADAGILSVDPANPAQMTAATPAYRPNLPSLLTRGVNAIQPSRFASAAEVTRAPVAAIDAETAETYEGETYEAPADTGTGSDSYSGPTPDPTPFDFYTAEPESDANSAPPPPPVAAETPQTEAPDQADETPPDDAKTWFTAPFVHVTASGRAFVVDFPYGEGEIVYVGDPYVVANGGITAADNAQFAVNLATARGGLIVFNEYHHGYGSGNNRVFEYFAGTPVIAILLQLTVLGLFVVYSRSRRFARPVPAPDPDRLSKLEYVGAMAELQQRTKAFDLAMENIYGDFRRRAARHFGIDNTTTSRKELAAMIAERTGHDAGDVGTLMQKCEDIVHGEPTDKRELLKLAGSLRELEEAMRLSRSSRRRI
ncbi:MAG: DUF4350 domain-containing protein [Acidobacteria bacterium]|nr:DUF4350 domain-containing protein [Acidobacteriota bacterium]